MCAGNEGCWNKSRYVGRCHFWSHCIYPPIKRSIFKVRVNYVRGYLQILVELGTVTLEWLWNGLSVKLERRWNDVGMMNLKCWSLPLRNWYDDFSTVNFVR